MTTIYEQRKIKELETRDKLRKEYGINNDGDLVIILNNTIGKRIVIIEGIAKLLKKLPDPDYSYKPGEMWSVEFVNEPGSKCNRRILSFKEIEQELKRVK